MDIILVRTFIVTPAGVVELVEILVRIPEKKF